MFPDTSHPNQVNFSFIQDRGISLEGMAGIFG